MKRLFIIGCSGHGKVVADIALKTKKYDGIYFLDDAPQSDVCMGISVEGNSDYQYFKEDDEVIVAIGNSEVRQRLQEKFEAKGLTIATLIHPSAVVGADVQIAKGTVVMAGAVINPSVHIGKGVIINTCSSVDHDNIIGDYSHISVGAHLAGTVSIGKHTWIGAGAVISNNISITDNVMIGAGGVVVKNIEQSGTYVGVPVRKI